MQKFIVNFIKNTAIFSIKINELFTNIFSRANVWDMALCSKC